MTTTSNIYAPSMRTTDTYSALAYILLLAGALVGWYLGDNNPTINEQGDLTFNWTIALLTFGPTLIAATILHATALIVKHLQAER